MLPMTAMDTRAFRGRGKLMATRPHNISAYTIANPLTVILKRMSEGRTFCAFICEAIRHGDQPVRLTSDVVVLKMGVKNVHRPLARITNADRFPALFKNFICGSISPGSALSTSREDGSGRDRLQADDPMANISLSYSDARLRQLSFVLIVAITVTMAQRRKPNEKKRNSA